MLYFIIIIHYIIDQNLIFIYLIKCLIFVHKIIDMFFIIPNLNLYFIFLVFYHLTIHDLFKINIILFIYFLLL